MTILTSNRYKHRDSCIFNDLYFLCEFSITRIVTRVRSESWGITIGCFNKSHNNYIETTVHGIFKSNERSLIMIPIMPISCNNFLWHWSKYTCYNGRAISARVTQIALTCTIVAKSISRAIIQTSCWISLRAIISMITIITVTF